MSRKLRYILVLLLFLAGFISPKGSWAASNTVTHESGSQILLDSTGNTYTVASDTAVESYTVNTAGIDFVVSSGSVVHLTAVSSIKFVASSHSCTETNVECNATLSSILLNCSSVSATPTITVTVSSCSNSGSGSGGGGQVVVDTTPPTNTSVVIAGGAASAASAGVSLTLGATDATYMMISNDSAFTSSTWIAYATSYSWTLSSGAGTKTVYAKFKDAAGNVSTAVSDTITLLDASTVEEVTVPAEGGNITFTLNTATPVSVGGVSHTITVSSASATEANLTVQSEPVTVKLALNVAKDIDTNGNGKNDLRLTYQGLDANGKPVVKLATVTEVTETPAETPGSSGTACALTKGKAYKTAASSAVYYITDECAKRPFKRADSYFTYFTSWADVQTATQAQLDSVAADTLGFMPWGPKYDPKYGALVKIVSDPKVYLLLGTEKYWITSETVFNTLKYAWSWIEDVDKGLVDKYTVGSEINYTDHHPNYTLVKYANSPKVYRLEPGFGQQVKRYIPDEATFKSLNFRWDRIVTLDNTETYSDGAELGVAGEKLVNYQFTSYLTAGSSGEEVKQLQFKLQALGYLAADVKATGYYGLATTEAVKAFQTAKGIDPTGYVGPATRNALNQ